MDQTIDKMLTDTAEIAELLIAAKDAGVSSLPSRAKELIAELAELAAGLPDHEPAAVPEPEREPAPVVEPAPEPEPEIREEPVENLGEEVFEEVIEQTPESVDEVTPEPEPEQTPEPAPQSVPEPEMKNPQPSEAPIREAGPRRADIALWRSLFSINDLFLFRRELFEGSDVLFNDALARIGDCRSVDDVKACLADNYGVDLRRPAAKEFVKIISSLF